MLFESIRVVVLPNLWKLPTASDSRVAIPRGVEIVIEYPPLRMRKSEEE
jgi:hypothetical protein